mgnify:CR=1 FL=1
MSEKKKQHGAGQLLPLFVSFLKIGAFTFGGGYAMIPLIQKEAADRHKWMTDEEIMEIVAIAESTPGPIAVNAATFTGYHAAGVPGAVLATIGVVMPAFLVIAAVSSALTLVSGNQWVKWAFSGVRAGVLALIAVRNVPPVSKKRAVLRYRCRGVHRGGVLQRQRTAADSSVRAVRAVLFAEEAG